MVVHSLSAQVPIPLIPSYIRTSINQDTWWLSACQQWSLFLQMLFPSSSAALARASTTSTYSASCGSLPWASTGTFPLPTHRRQRDSHESVRVALSTCMHDKPLTPLVVVGVLAARSQPKLRGNIRENPPNWNILRARERLGEIRLPCVSAGRLLWSVEVWF